MFFCGVGNLMLALLCLRPFGKLCLKQSGQPPSLSGPQETEETAGDFRVRRGGIGMIFILLQLDGRPSNSTATSSTHSLPKLPWMPCATWACEAGFLAVS